MRIGIVLHPYGEDKPAGLGRAIYEVTRSLIELDTENHYIVYLRKRPRTLPTFAGNNWEVKIIDHPFLWLDIGLFREKLDVCFFNTPVMPFFVRPKRSIVITYDYAYCYFENNWKLKLYHGFSLRRADHIIAISGYTKGETTKLYGIPEEKISVVYLGFKDFCEGASKGPSPLTCPFFLFVGVIKERKNVLGVVKAFHTFKQKVKSDHLLVILGWGSGSYFESIRSYIKENDLEASIIIDQSVVGDMLTPYYQHAEALLYPSFIEGFGFPVLEAMSCDLPVITSNTSSLPEAAGDAALLVDPKDSEGIATAMQRLVTEKGLRAALVEKGHLQMKKFSWKKTGEGYLRYIRSL